MRRTAFQSLATICLLMACAVEYRQAFVLHAPWKGFEDVSVLLAALLLATWAAAIVGIWTNRALSNFAFVTGIFVVLATGLSLAQSSAFLPSLLFTGLAAVAAASMFGARYSPAVEVTESGAWDTKSRAA